jgi:hypothetical protein
VALGVLYFKSAFLIFCDSATVYPFLEWLEVGICLFMGRRMAPAKDGHGLDATQHELQLTMRVSFIREIIHLASCTNSTGQIATILEYAIVTPDGCEFFRREIENCRGISGSKLSINKLSMNDKSFTSRAHSASTQSVSGSTCSRMCRGI